MTKENLSVVPVDEDLQRLRAQRAAYDKQAHDAWHARGKRWALKEATYQQVRRVAQLAEGEFDSNSEGTQSCADLAAAIIGADVSDVRDVRDVIEIMGPIFGEEQPADAVFDAFVEGVAEVYDTI